MKQKLGLRLIMWGLALLEPALQAECRRCFNQAVENLGIGGYHDISRDLGR
jgi:hypothetical protein